MGWVFYFHTHCVRHPSVNRSGGNVISEEKEINEDNDTKSFLFYVTILFECGKLTKL